MWEIDMRFELLTIDITEDDFYMGIGLIMNPMKFCSSFLRIRISKNKNNFIELFYSKGIVYLFKKLFVKKKK